MKKYIILLLSLVLSAFVYGQTIERIAFSSVASSNDNFQPVAGTPYGAHLSNANGSLTVAAEYGDNTIDEEGLITSAQQTETQQWRVYPSPTQDVLHIELPEQATVSLYSNNGQLVQTQTGIGMPYIISMAGYATGQYMLLVEDTNGKRTYRVIKK